MTRILTGIQSTGIPHLGNILGAIMPAIEMANDSKNDSFLFIADMHSLTTIHDANVLKENTYSVAAAWLAFGLDVDKTVFYRQSDVPEVAELTWYLSCFTPYPMLANAVSFKDKLDRLSEVNAGVFLYPVLMAADIILYDAHYVPTGKDQLQHLEITRDIASSFNSHYGETFVVPEATTVKEAMLIPGIDGQKMSKSYNNTINIFLQDKDLRKVIMKIVTDTTPIEQPKNPDTCTVFKLYTLVAEKDKVEAMRQNYLQGGYGYGHAKEELYQTIVNKFQKERELYNHYMSNKAELDKKLKQGEDKARIVAAKTLKRVREKLGYN
ncbi:MAG TPA: tryptophan--tRNA ligase [Bacteroidia bacterium]|jgi:tryptophanyl-tRNA synthetase|nr:tryptophan--tRNA ligase [Bacteroidia bacterium]